MDHDEPDVFERTVDSAISPRIETATELAAAGGDGSLFTRQRLCQPHRDRRRYSPTSASSSVAILTLPPY